MLLKWRFLPCRELLVCQTQLTVVILDALVCLDLAPEVLNEVIMMMIINKELLCTHAPHWPFTHEPTSTLLSSLLPPSGHLCCQRFLFYHSFPPLPLPPSSPYHWWELPQVSFLLQQHVWNMPLSRQNRSCRDRNIFSWQIFFRNNFCHTFVATKDVFCCDKHMFVMTKLAATKMILVAAPDNDTSLHQLKHLSVPCLSIHIPPLPQTKSKCPLPGHCSFTCFFFKLSLSVLLNFT